jgi:hypothetical protein
MADHGGGADETLQGAGAFLTARLADELAL